MVVMSVHADVFGIAPAVDGAISALPHGGDVVSDPATGVTAVCGYPIDAPLHAVVRAQTAARATATPAQ